MIKNKEYFFLLDLKKPTSEEANDKVEFTNLKEKDALPKCIKTNEENDKIVKVFQFNNNITKDNKVSFEFYFDGKKYKVNIENMTDKTFIFDVFLKMQGKRLIKEK